MVGWGGRIRTSVWRNQNPLPYHLATPQWGRIRPARGRTIEAEVACRNRKAGVLEQHLPLMRAGSRRPEMGLVLPAGADYKGPVAAPWGRHVGV